jgi:DNA-binding response OmpR family regulator
MSGIDLVRLLEKAGRVRPTLFISGYFGDDLDLQGFGMDCYGFLQKPLVRESLDAALRDCMRRFQLAQPGGSASTV